MRKDQERVYAPAGNSQDELQTTTISLVKGPASNFPDLKQNDLLIPSGYAREVQLLQSMLRGCDLYDLPVKTVEGSQVAEAYIAVLSIVRDGGDLGFVQSSAKASKHRIFLEIGDFIGTRTQLTRIDSVFIHASSIGTPRLFAYVTMVENRNSQDPPAIQKPLSRYLRSLKALRF